MDQLEAETRAYEARQAAEARNYASKKDAEVRTYLHKTNWIRWDRVGSGWSSSDTPTDDLHEPGNYQARL